ncbi:MAG: hypothetical protein R6X22_07620 [Gemmatimonadota bacterium]
MKEPNLPVPDPDLVPCRFCSHDVTREARRCPRCGHEHPGQVPVREATRGIFVVGAFTLGVILAVFLLFAFVL